jgi:hypothetical protein
MCAHSKPSLTKSIERPALFRWKDLQVGLCDHVPYIDGLRQRCYEESIFHHGEPPRNSTEVGKISSLILPSPLTIGGEGKSRSALYESETSGYRKAAGEGYLSEFLLYHPSPLSSPLKGRGI